MGACKLCMIPWELTSHSKIAIKLIIMMSYCLKKFLANPVSMLVSKASLDPNLKLLFEPSSLRQLLAKWVICSCVNGKLMRLGNAHTLNLTWL